MAAVAKITEKNKTEKYVLGMEFQVDIGFVKDQLETNQKCKYEFCRKCQKWKKVLPSIDSVGIIKA